MSIRTERVSRMLQREIAEILSKDYSDQFKPLVTVTGVRMTNDLSIASVYVSVLGDDDEQRKALLERLKDLASQIRFNLAARIRHQLKSVPSIRFFLDESLTEAARLEELFGRINEEREGPDAVS